MFYAGNLAGRLPDNKKKNDQVKFGPVDVVLDEGNIFQPDLITIGTSDEYGSIRDGWSDLPKFVVEILAGGNVIYDCLDKAVMYRGNGVKEYWLIDLNEQFVYTYNFRQGFDYRRYSFDQSIRSLCYPGFECCLSEIMWQDGGSLKELALFYRFRQEIYPNDESSDCRNRNGLFWF